MASVIITFKVVLEAPETEPDEVKGKVASAIEEYGGDIGSVDVEEVAFGIKALKIVFIMDEKKGSTDKLEETIKELEGVSSLEVIDVRRAIG